MHITGAAARLLGPCGASVDPCQMNSVKLNFGKMLPTEVLAASSRDVPPDRDSSYALMGLFLSVSKSRSGKAGRELDSPTSLSLRACSAIALQPVMLSRSLYRVSRSSVSVDAVVGVDDTEISGLVTRSCDVSCGRSGMSPSFLGVSRMVASRLSTAFCDSVVNVSDLDSLYMFAV